ncbi:MAG: SRPBCC domain-containing protein [Methanothrix sp.]|nr:MAG: SRPBCC domain-containing protein [Methanothrix sp.]
MSGLIVLLALVSFLIIAILCAAALVAAKKSITQRTLQAEIVINAPATNVWKVLIDFEAYPQWNPFIRQVTGKAEPGEKLTIQMHLGNRMMTINPTVLSEQPQRELRWLGHFFIPGLFDGEHSFVIEPLGERKVRFIQSEEFSGLIIPFSKTLLNETEQNFNEMNMALKERAEHTD